MVILPDRDRWRSHKGSFVLGSLVGFTLYPRQPLALFVYNGLDAVGNAASTPAQSWIYNAPETLIDGIQYISGTTQTTFVLRDQNGPSGQAYLSYAFIPPHYPYTLSFGDYPLRIPSGITIGATGGNQLINIHYRCPKGRGE